MSKTQEAIYQTFRTAFLDALGRRQLEKCLALLADLAQQPALFLQHEHRYHAAILHLEQQQIDEAEKLLTALITQPLTTAQIAKVRLALAILHDEQGQWGHAEALYHQALASYKKIVDARERDLGIAKCYNNLGISISFQIEQGTPKPGANQQERLQEAAAYHQQALALVEKAAEEVEIAKNHRGLGVVYALMGEYRRARSEFEQHIAICEQLDDDASRARGLSELAAYVLQPQQEWAAAHAALNEAIPLFDEFQDELNLAEALTRRGNLLAAQSQHDEAMLDYQLAIQKAESLRTRLMAPTVQVNYRSTVEFIYTAPLTLQLEQGRANEAMTYAEHARARVMADLLAGQRAQPRALRALALLKQRQALHKDLDQAYADENAAVHIPSLETALTALDRQIELADPNYYSLGAVDALSAAQVSQRLPANSVLVSYVSDAQDRLWILVATPEGTRQPYLIPNITSTWLRSFLTDHLDGQRRGILVPDQKGHLESPHLLYPPLYDAFIKPIQQLLTDAETVYIIPTGPLHYLPLGALSPDLATPPPLLAAGKRLIYAPSATILLNYCHQVSPSPYRSVLAIAPPDENLRFIDGAARTIAGLNGGSSSEQSIGVEVEKALLDTQANRQALLTSAQQHRIVCFFGHAVFNSANPMLSSITLADGTMHASEMLHSLRLNCDLLILAACESGRGQVQRGDEILGLVRALLYAGTPAILVTLWRVHEIPTRLLIEKLLEQLPTAEKRNQPFDPAISLATTQLWLRALTYREISQLMAKWEETKEELIAAQLTALWQMTHPKATPNDDSALFAHPFFWSPYILVGEQQG